MGRALIIILIFAGVGPLVGLATVSAIVTAIAYSHAGLVDLGPNTLDTDSPMALGLATLVLGAFGAHVIGIVWAALAGAIVALRTSLWGPASIFEGVPIGVFTALASAVTYDFDLTQTVPRSPGLAGLQAGAGWMLIHIMSAMACIWLTKGWQVRDSGTS
jgi:hypothetical protein